MSNETGGGVYYIDAIVGILLIIASVCVAVVGADYIKTISEMGFGVSPPAMITFTGYAILIFGIAGILYGVKRTIDGIIKAQR